MSHSDYKKVRTNLFDLLPEVYRSAVNESILETTFNRFLSKTEIDRKIGYIGQGNPNALISRQIQEPTPHRQGYQLQPIIHSQIGTVEHMASSQDILNELARLGIDIDRMKLWGDALSFNWAPPVDYDKLINYRDYYWENIGDITDQPQYVTIQNPCTRAQAQLSEYNNTKEQFGTEFNIVGLDSATNAITIEGDLTQLFVKDFVFYIKDSTNATINDDFYVTVSSSRPLGLDRTIIIVDVAGSPSFSDSPVDGVVSLEELTAVFQSASDCACNGSVGWDGGQWDDNQIGDILWNTQLLQDITFATEALWIIANGPPSAFDLWYDTTTNTLKQYVGGSPAVGWMVVQSNFSNIIANTTGGNAWDLSTDCETDYNVWQQQNKWVHKNQVMNFALAKQAQIPIIEFLPTVQLNEWAQTFYQWKYRAAPAVDTFEEIVAQPNLFELTGVVNDPSSPGTVGFVVDPALDKVVLSSRYGDLTSVFVPGYQFRVEDDGVDLNNNIIYTVDWSTYCEESDGQKLQTQISLTNSFSSVTSDGTMVPALTSQGDHFVGVYDHWVFVGVVESLPIDHQSPNIMTAIPFNPPPAPIPFTTSGSPALTLGQYELGLYAQSLTLTVKSFGTIPMSGVSGSPSRWVLTGNHASVFNDSQFGIIGNALVVQGDLGGGVNGEYTIVSAIDVGANTEVAVAETIPAAAIGNGSGYVFWTFTFDPTLHNQTRFGTNELRLYVDNIRQYGTYTEVNAGAATTSPSVETCDDYVNSVIVQTPIDEFSTIRVAVGASAAIDVGLENVPVRTDENDLTFMAPADLECVSLVKFRKLEQIKTSTNQYPLFDLFDVEGQPLGVASKVFAFQESQDAPIDVFFGRRIVHSEDRRVYYYEQFLLSEANGPMYVYRDTCTCRTFGFWFDTDNAILYRWNGSTWDINISTTDYASASGSPIALNCYVSPVVSEDPPGVPWIGIDGMIWFNTNNNTINVSNGTMWIEDPALTSATVSVPTDPTLQSIWRSGPDGVPCEQKEIYVPSFVDKDRNPVLHHSIVDVVSGSPGTWTIYDGVDAQNILLEDIQLLEVGDIIRIGGNLDILSNKAYTVLDITKNEILNTVTVQVATIPGTATISGFVARVGDAEADWEVPDQLYFNNSHENRKILSSTDLVSHMLSIINSQEVPPGLFGTSATLFHALTDINFGAGGTIKEFNDSYDTFISSIFTQTISPPSLYEFGHDAYATALNQIKEGYRQNVNTFMTDVSEEVVADIATGVANELIEDYEQNDYANFVFGDSNTYIQETDVGIRHWPATLPFVRLHQKVEPVLLDDPTISVNGLRHHDGHISQDGFLPTSLNIFAQRIISTPDTRTSNPSGFMGLRSVAVPPADFSVYESTFGKTSACYWYQSTTVSKILYRMTAVRVSTNLFPPSTTLPEGSFWYDITSDRLKVLTSLGGSPATFAWTNATVATGKLTEGSVSAWQVTDINEILAETLLELETRLFQAAPDFGDIAFDFEQTVADSPDLTARYYRDAFFEFVSQLGITDPFSNDGYDATDPFTWNYKTSTNTTSPRIGEVFVDGGIWQDVYEKNYGTPYPHLEPWMLQGYTSRPTWWNTEYADITGSRRWTPGMWRNVLDGVVPVGQFLPSGSLSTGAGAEVQSYNYVSVNIDTVTIDGYAPDSIFPPFWSFTVPPPVGSPSFAVSEIRSIFLAGQVNTPDADYQYDDSGPVQWNWESSSQYLYDTLKVAFRLQPVRFIQQTLGEVFLEIGCLQISQALQNVYAHQNARFQGDLLADNTVLVFPGMLQWYANYNRFGGYDSSSSNFRPMWTNWTTPLGYLFATFVDTESFIVFNRNFDISTQDYEIRIKKSPGIEDHWVEAFDITLIQSPPTLIRVDTQSQWVFDVGTLSPIGRTINYFASQSYNFTVDTSTSPTQVLDTMTVVDVYGRDLPWVDGEGVVISSTEFLPSPLLPDTQYYVNVIGPTSFSLSAEPGGPVIDILSTGVGTLSVSNIARSFVALDGAATDDKVWYIYELDRTLVLELFPPTVMSGMENVINVIASYAAYEHEVENFSFNHEATDIDPATNRVVDWQLEIERFIAWAYSARTFIQRRQSFYSWEVDAASPSSLKFRVVTEINSQGQPVTYSETPSWTTGTAVRLFTATGAVLPDPFLLNTTYYYFQSGVDEFQLALTSKNARNGIAIPVTSSGSGDMFVQQLVARNLLPSQEVNPFRNNLWVDTPQGIVSNLFEGPFPDVRTDELVYDQHGNRLPTSEVLPLRQDTQTRIIVQDGITNVAISLLPEIEQQYNFLHLSSAHIFIDGYEHVLLFNDYAVGGALIYDPFLGLNTPKFDVQFDRAPEFTLRPNVGGYVLLNQPNLDFSTSLIRNMEGQTEDLRFAYDTYNVIEANALVEEGRDSLGYDGPFDFLSAININPKSQFIFWRGLIQAKGSVNSIKAFINSRRFVDAKVDEFWSYQIAEFGDAKELSLPEVNLFADDTRTGEIRMQFVEEAGTADRGFVEVLSNDQVRWYERPNQQEFFDANGNMYFNVKLTTLQVTVADFISATFGPAIFFLELPIHTDNSIVVDSAGTNIPSSGFTWLQVNSKTLSFIVPGTYTIYMISPYESKQNPCKIRDVVEEVTVADAILWDPARDNHYHNAIHLVDVQRDTDPAAIFPGGGSPVQGIYEFILWVNGEIIQTDPTTIDPWGSSEVDTTWLDTNRLGYIPYADTTLFPDVLDRLKFWGRPAQWASYVMYQWTASSVPPDEYDTLSAFQDGDFSIDPQIRVTGSVRKNTYIFITGSFAPWRIYPIEKYEVGSKNFFNGTDAVNAFTQPNSVGNNPLAVGSPAEIPQFKAYRNGIEYVGSLADQENGYYYGAGLGFAVIKFAADMIADYGDSDFITLLKYFPTPNDIDDTFWKQNTPYNTENHVENGENVTKYYFWVENKTVPQTWRNKTLSMVEAEQQLETIPVPYVILQNQEPVVTEGSPPVVIRPRRYTQSILRNYGTLINADDRYVLRFTRNFILRDYLTDTVTTPSLINAANPVNGCPLSLTTTHQEWKLFRREQPFHIPRYLWNLMTESIIGQTLASLGGTAVRVPSLDRELFDVENNTSTRIGIAQTGQSFCDGEQGWDAIMQYLQDGNNDFAPIDIQAFFANNDILNLTPQSPSDAQALADVLDEIYNSFTFNNVNNMYFSVLETAAMSFQVKYEDMFKTSWVALHGIRILETAGIFDD